MELPFFQTTIRELSLLQTKWRSILNPQIANPLTQGLILKNVVLKIGTNTINHHLGRTLQGWFTVRVRAMFPALYDLQDSNQNPDLTLVLHSDTDSSVDLYVF